MNIFYLFFLLFVNSIFCLGNEKVSLIEQSYQGGIPGTYRILFHEGERELSVLLVKETMKGEICTIPAYIREDGYLAKRQAGYPFLELNLSDLKKGEPVTLSFIPCDRTRTCTKILTPEAIKFFPKPLNTTNGEGIVFSCEIVDHPTISLSIKMDGLKSGEEVFFTSPLFGEKVEVSHIADENGIIEFLYQSEISWEMFPQFFNSRF